ncbi:hypothetical protein SLEP1_g5004 [Rubroshorea leprosula]|uniref:Sulfotransferase n=1 Tax=Rubroshorea leprosula TaxID=152421 RepID=A0AAV5HQV9_9ROSI|nr:hypothetical protein SLEP1_g5004 [Rubroshorea leprosula]
MAQNQASNASTQVVSPETLERVREIISTLPSDNCWKHVQPFCLYQGFWCYPFLLEGVILAQEFFKAEPSDIFLCTPPKHGTTWIKALTIAIVTRTRFDRSMSPLLSNLPHDILHHLEEDFGKKPDVRVPGLPLIPTHIPYDSLPKSVKDSDCKIVYVRREIKDAFTSEYNFSISLSSKDRGECHDYDEPSESMPLEEAFELFCEGKSLYGPCWDHILGYWKASLERPGRVLFLKYEDLKKDTAFYVKKLAEFMGYPFSMEEEQEGVVQKIVDLCSFENLSSLEVNKTGTFHRQGLLRFPNKSFFRKGEVGDWKNHLTPEMAERLDKIMKDKLIGSGLSFSA